MRDPNGPIMTNVSLAATVASNPVIMEQEVMCAIQAVWTGTPVGDFTVETCDDVGNPLPDGTVTGLTNWDTYTGSTLAAGGSTGVFTWRIHSLPDRWVRLKYTATSSTGTINARFNAKGAA